MLSLLLLVLFAGISSSLFFLNIVFEFWYYCIHAVFNPGMSSSPVFFLTHIVYQYHLWTVRSYRCILISFLVTWSLCLSSSLGHFKKGLQYLTKRYKPSDSPFDEFSTSETVFRTFIVLLIYTFRILSFNFTYYYYH